MKFKWKMDDAEARKKSNMVFILDFMHKITLSHDQMDSLCAAWLAYRKSQQPETKPKDTK